ncbi:hypothetical protein Bca4012_026080 [Brassica carinata]
MESSWVLLWYFIGKILLVEHVLIERLMMNFINVDLQEAKISMLTSPFPSSQIYKYERGLRVGWIQCCYG